MMLPAGPRPAPNTATSGSSSKELTNLSRQTGRQTERRDTESHETEIRGERDRAGEQEREQVRDI